MKYVGSKNRLSKDIVPIIQSHITEETKGYLEPFVGGANMIDKIRCKKRIGCDIHKELIALLRYVQNHKNKLPQQITEEEYKKVKDNKEEYPDWYVGLVGFGASFGAKYFGGYARGFKADKITPRNHSNESIRNIEKQRKNLEGIYFLNKSFMVLPKDKIKNYVVYCDPPYRGTLKYKTENFPYEEFYKWCVELSKNNTVLISEYQMPDGFKCIWEKEHTTAMDIGPHAKRIEKLFMAC